MGDRITTYDDCAKCGSKGTFECYEALSSEMKLDRCTKCGYTVNYTFEERDGLVHIEPVEEPSMTPKQTTGEKIEAIVLGVIQDWNESMMFGRNEDKSISDIGAKAKVSIGQLLAEQDRESRLDELKELQSQSTAYWVGSETKGQFVDAVPIEVIDEALKESKGEL